MLFRPAADPKIAAPLFRDWEETMIWSCLSGVMGQIWVDDPLCPRSAAAILGDFIFLAGVPDRNLLLQLPIDDNPNTRSILVPQTGDWSALIETCWGEEAVRYTRWAFRKEPDIFDTAHLRQAASSLPEGFRLTELDEHLYHSSWHEPWRRDWVARYPDWPFFQQYALGMVVLKDGEPVAGASSYSSWPGGIEIEIDTREDCRRLGLAYAAAAALILRCLERGWYPSWDAQNAASAALAEKLGYHVSHQYPAYDVTGPVPPKNKP